MKQTARRIAASSATTTTTNATMKRIAFNANAARIASSSRCLHQATWQRAQYSFDTAHFVNRLEREGLSRKQAVGVMEALNEVVEESVRTMTANLVTKAEQEKHRYTQKVDFQRLKSEITLLEKQDFSLLKSENERLLSEVERLKQRLREEVRSILQDCHSFYADCIHQITRTQVMARPDSNGPVNNTKRDPLTYTVWRPAGPQPRERSYAG
jgi:hypothetical protein